MEGSKICSVAPSNKWLVGDVPSQHWTKIVWTKWNIFEASFMTWLATQNKLKTRDRFKNWNIVQDTC